MCGFFSRLVLAAFLMSGVLLPISASAETLQDALRAAVKKHPSMDVAKAGYMAARQEEREAFSGYFPVFNVSGAVGRIYQDNATSRGLDVVRGAGYSGYGEGNISMRQHIFDGFKTERRLNAAEASTLREELGIVEVKNDLIFRTSQSYLDILRIAESINLLEEQRQKIIGYEEKITSLVEEGVSDEVEGQQARDVRMIVDGLIADYKGQYRSARAQYLELTGNPATGDFMVPESLAAEISQDISGEIALAGSYHYSLLIADADIESAKAEMKAAKAEYYPDMDGEVSYSKIDKRDLIGGESKDVRALLRMNWRFSIGGKQDANIKKLLYRYEEAKAKKEEIARQINQAIEVAFAQYETAREKLALAQERITLNKTLFETYKAQYEGARISLLAMMRAESQLFSARLEEIENRYGVLLSEFYLLSSSGRLEDIVLNDQPEETSH